MTTGEPEIGDGADLAAGVPWLSASGGAGESSPGHHGAPGAAGQLLDPTEAATFAERWAEIQAAFVDEPRQAVVDADALVEELIQRLTRMFADERALLEQGLDRDDAASTEDLRVGLQRYRDFFHRLLSA